MFVSLEARAWDVKGDAVLDALVTTAAGALSATVGVLVGGIVTRRAQDRHWIRDQQLAAYQELFSHYAKFTMELRRAHADRRGWDYDWGDWSATLMRVSLIAPTEVAVEIDDFGSAINSFLDQVARGERNPLRSTSATCVPAIRPLTSPPLGNCCHRALPTVSSALTA